MDEFHESKKPAAVLKHGIIDSYAAPFIGKTGKWSINNRVAFIDGYAGPGRYGDDQEGSGAMLIRHAKKQEATPRSVELHFVEQDLDAVSKLRQVVKDESGDIAVTVHDGDISTHLPSLLERCKGIPLFVYLDPCGLIIPLDEVARVFERPGGQGSPATEILINFSAVALRRFAGHLTSDKAVEGVLARMDKVCGGDWWRQAWLDHLPDKEAAEQAVVKGYAARLSTPAGSGHWVIDVRPRADLKPLYYLIFATRHVAGMEYFGEASSLGMEKWRKYLAEQDAKNTLFENDGSWEESFKTQEQKVKIAWADVIAGRLADELSKGQAFRVLDRYDEVFGELAGVARGMHLRAAMKKVHGDGLTSTSPVGVTRLLELRLNPM